jgi:hypothetical protein
MIRALENSRAKLTLIIALILFSLYNLNSYKGSEFVFLVFSGTSIFYIYRSLTVASSFFNLFICGLLSLGFFFKLNIHLVTDSYIFGDTIGSFSFLESEYDRALILATAGLFGFLTSNEIVIWLSRFSGKSLIFQNFDLSKKDWQIPGRYLACIGFLLIAISLLINFSNLHFNIYQRGVVSSVSGIIIAIWTIMLMFGLSLLFATLIQINQSAKGQTFYFVLLAMIDAALTSVSMLSRAFILFAGVFIFCFWYTSKSQPTGKKALQMCVLICTYFALTMLTVKAVSEIRYKSYSSITASGGDAPPTDNPEKFESTFLRLLIGRWVGFEGVMSSTSFKGDRELTFKRILNEKIGSNISIYDSEVTQSSYIGRKVTKFRFVTVPGIIGWLSLRDSVAFVFIGCLFISFLFFSVEHLFSRVFSSVWISAVVGHVLAFRVAHFGFVPLQTYKLLIGLLSFGLVLCFILLVLRRLFPPLRNAHD